ncbi:hypothetical protein GGE17_000995 [Rhizobium leguminosarum]|jgi:hypothetical protein|nr:hypothetical protein [Rhizobium leguminosarum]MBB4339600.1 hypothetical protein [Rhizobium leguminosarum]MBB4355715.1 hypothetical protein [Rhizobium leguminosarum]MBB4549852.1 hypothetical protein [Rhizobium leguminosarum]MBB4560414.1 hypothetical protein [Rhizobium leguminosarum]
MIASQDDAFGWKISRCGDVLDEPAKVHRRHRGIAALLIDLIAGGFDEDRPVLHAGTPKGCLNDQRMSRADRSDAMWKGQVPGTEKLSQRDLPVLFDPRHASVTTFVR